MGERRCATRWQEGASASPYLRPLKKKGFKEERATTIGLYDSGKSTTLESNKSQAGNRVVATRRNLDQMRTVRARATIQGVKNEPHHQHLDEAWYS
jgi:hypothetical protein